MRSVACRLLRWYGSHARPLPWRRSNDPYAIWISEIMLQQTQVQTVIPYWERWMQCFPNVEALAKAPLPQVLKIWEGLGYYTRARNLHKAAGEIVSRDSGRLPLQFDDWLSLPGIGRYTAGAICSIAFNQATPILDGNAARVLARMFALPLPVQSTPARKQLWSWAAQLVESAANLKSEPGPRCSHFNQAVMELGATVCLPRQPLCPECPIQSNCQAFQQGIQEQIPLSAPAPAPTERNLAALVVHQGNRFLVSQRPEQGVNAGLWEFPTVEVPPFNDMEPMLRRLVGKPIRGLNHWTSLHYTITRYRIKMHVFRAEVIESAEFQSKPDSPARFTPVSDNSACPAVHETKDFTGSSLATNLPFPFTKGKWLMLKELDRLPFSAAHRRLLRMLAKHGQSAKTEKDGIR